MRTFILEIDSPQAIGIKYTSEAFESGIIWNLLPKGLNIMALEPRNEQAIPDMIRAINDHGIRFRYCNPPADMANMLRACGYIECIEKCGTYYFCNFEPKRKTHTTIIRHRVKEELLLVK